MGVARSTAPVVGLLAIRGVAIVDDFVSEGETW